MSKGSVRRPAQIPPDEEARRWEEVFGKQWPAWDKDRDQGPPEKPRKRCPDGWVNVPPFAGY